VISKLSQNSARKNRNSNEKAPRLDKDDRTDAMLFASRSAPGLGFIFLIESIQRRNLSLLDDFQRKYLRNLQRSVSSHRFCG